LRKIIRAGKDVMTTKPFEDDPAAARTVLEEAEEIGRVIHLNSPSPQPPAWIEHTERWRTQFGLGRPVGARAEVVVSYREKQDDSWYDDPALCPAPPVFRLGIYLINDLVRLFGAVSEIQIVSSRLFTERPTADNAQLSLLFKNGAIGSIYASFCVENGQAYANSFVLHYERGTIHRNLRPTAYGRAHIGSRLTLITANASREAVIEECEVDDPESTYRWDLFYEAVTKRGSVSIGIDDIVHGIEVISVMACAETSQRTERISLM
jgi:predicted dehydrogenase